MKNEFELSYKKLKSTCNVDLFNFDTTDTLQPINTGIGQDRGIKALEFGLNVDINGYNIYLEGPSGLLSERNEYCCQKHWRRECCSISLTE